MVGFLYLSIVFLQKIYYIRRKFYNMANNVIKYQDPAQPLINRINTSKANFVQRLLDPNRKHIQDWVRPLYTTTHKLGWAHDSSKKNKQGAFVYPEVQEIDGELIDFTHPSHRRSEGIDSAIERRDTVRMTPEQAEWFTTHYKEYYPEFQTGGVVNPKFKKSQNAYYDPNTNTVFAPDSTGEFYLHEMFHARPDTKLLQALKPYYHNLNDDVLKQFGADLSFVKRINNDPGHFYSPEELGARVVSANQMLKDVGISNINADFLKNARTSENKYGDNFRDLLHMYNDENLIKIFNLIQNFKKGGSIHIKKKNRGKFTESAKRAGMGVQEFAKHVLANKEDYSSTQIKRANFARNSKKFKHKNGGIMIPYIIKFFGGGELPMFQQPNGPLPLGSGENHPGRYRRVTDIGVDSKNRSFGFTEEEDGELGLVRETRTSNRGKDKDTLLFVNTPYNQQLFTSPYKPTPMGADQMSPEMWKRYNDHMDALKQQWLDNPHIR